MHRVAAARTPQGDARRSLRSIRDGVAFNQHFTPTSERAAGRGRLDCTMASAFSPPMMRARWSRSFGQVFGNTSLATSSDSMPERFLAFSADDGDRAAQIIPEDGAMIFRHACALGCEGIVSKCLDFDLSLRPRRPLAQGQEPGRAGSEAGRRGGLGQQTMGARTTKDAMIVPRFPPPWDIEEANAACFIVKDNNGHALHSTSRTIAADARRRIC